MSKFDIAWTLSFDLNYMRIPCPLSILLKVIFDMSFSDRSCEVYFDHNDNLYHFKFNDSPNTFVYPERDFEFHIRAAIRLGYRILRLDDILPKKVKIKKDNSLQLLFPL